MGTPAILIDEADPTPVDINEQRFGVEIRSADGTAERYLLSRVQIMQIQRAKSSGGRVGPEPGSFSVQAYIRNFGRRDDQAPTLGAYAPDPDADFNAGVRHGYQLGLRAPSPVRWQHKQVGRRVELVKLAVAIAVIVAVTVAMVS